MDDLIPGEVSRLDQHRMARYLKKFAAPRDTRAAHLRFSKNTPGRSIEWIIAAAERRNPTARMQLPDDWLLSLPYRRLILLLDIG